MKAQIERIILASVLFLLIFLPWFTIQARSGCCSHHGGVCGCSCCDGTSLSAKCAPYYPQCSAVKSTQTQFEIPQSTVPQPAAPKPIAPNTENQQANKNSINSKNLIAENSKEEKDSALIWPWILGIGLGGYIFYKFTRKDIKTNQG